jgi:ABC-2 type transport system permease protein
MSKILTIIRREFLVRLRSRGFIVATLLAPVAFGALLLAPIFLTMWSPADGLKTITVVDETGLLFDELTAPASMRLLAAESPVETLREQVRLREIDGFLVLPADLLEGSSKASFYSLGGGGLSFRFELEAVVDRAVRDRRVRTAGIPEEVVQLLQRKAGLEMNVVTTEGQQRDDTGLMTVVGYLMGIIVYMAVFIYGSLVMRGVIEEKTSRIMEVVVSSARPFQLMMGKVLGIGALGLVQMALWFGASAALVLFGGALAAGFLDPSAFNLPDSASNQAILEAADIRLPQIPASLLLYFLIFFVGGYLLYAALFAAVGSAVDQEADAQQFVLPVALPVILALLFIGPITDHPDSLMAVVASMVPLFSPILMIVRLSITQVPLWQAFLSLALLAATVVGTIWMAARIYRVGILMYGKKAGFRDLARWLRTP